MNVYRISTFPKPPGNKFQNYAQLDCDKRDDSFLATDRFRGRKFPEKWRRITLHFSKPLWPRAEFYSFLSGAFVCSERAKLLCQFISPRSGEFLPVQIEGEEKTHYIYNVLHCPPAFDKEKSVFKFYEPKKVNLGLLSPSFTPSELEGVDVFKVLECAYDIFCVERPGGFKSLVEDHQMKGLKFDLVWSSRGGVVIKVDPPTLPGIRWKTGDGKGYRVK